MKQVMLTVALSSLLLQPLYMSTCPDEGYSPSWYEIITRAFQEYKKSVLCLLARARAGSAPIEGAVYYIRHRTYKPCLVYHAGATCKERPLGECPYHQDELVAVLLDTCRRAVTYHNKEHRVIKTEADWFSGERADLPGGPYAKRLAKKGSKIDIE